MKLFSRLFLRVMNWSRHRHAPYYLSGLSFAEASFFPIPPDVMLVPMSMAEPKRSWYFAWLTTLFSVLGGLFGYLMGYALFEIITPYLINWGYWDTYQQALNGFNEWGFWAVIIAGFTPIPYKIFTLAAGSLHMALMPFILASFIGRGARFFLIALIMRYCGVRLEQSLIHRLDRLMIILISLFILGFIGWLCYKNLF
ncbi:MAG: DedA family protein [Legionellales bacterium]|nr:DedA family protein [Legionellales bacterium]